MNLQVKLFATLKDRAGSSTVAIELPDETTVSGLLDRLAAAQPKLAAALPTLPGRDQSGIRLWIDTDPIG